MTDEAGEPRKVWRDMRKEEGRPIRAPLCYQRERELHTWDTETPWRDLLSDWWLIAFIALVILGCALASVYLGIRELNLPIRPTSLGAAVVPIAAWKRPAPRKAPSKGPTRLAAVPHGLADMTVQEWHGLSTEMKLAVLHYAILATNGRM